KGDGSEQVDQQVELAFGHDEGDSFPWRGARDEGRGVRGEGGREDGLPLLVPRPSPLAPAGAAAPRQESAHQRLLGLRRIWPSDWDEKSEPDFLRPRAGPQNVPDGSHSWGIARECGLRQRPPGWSRPRLADRISSLRPANGVER